MRKRMREPEPLTVSVVEQSHSLQIREYDTEVFLIVQRVIRWDYPAVVIS